MILAITTSTSRGGVALVEDAIALAAVAYDDAQGHAELLVPTIDRLFGVSFARDAVRGVACDLGPGSFTGVRVGLATAKGIALALRVPLVGVGSLEAMAAAAFAESSCERVACLLDAKRGETYFGVFGRAAAGGLPRVVAEPAHTRTSELGAVLGDFGADLRCCGGPAAALGWPPERLVTAEACVLPSAEWIGRLAQARSATLPPEALDAASAEPIYLRPPDAVPAVPRAR
jgi:tRNA threonylcarbamoyladenosine biosynthesis protein TsaB